MIRSLTAAFVLLTPLAWAQEASPTPDPKAEEILAAYARFFQDAKSFQVHISSKMSVEAKGMKNEMESAYDLAVQRPSSLALVLKSGMMGGNIVSDGTTAITYLPMLKKYTSVKAPGSLSELFDPMVQAMISQALPFGFEPLLAKDIAADLRENTESITYVGKGDVSGTAAHQVRFTMKTYQVDLWIADGARPTLLRCEVAFNVSALPEEQAKAMEIKSAKRETLYTDWKVNDPIEASVFTFQPPAEAEKVDSFMPKSAGHEKPNALLDQAAPDFVLKNLLGEEVKLSSQQGKIVVIDFWATWCPPCVKGLPIVAEVLSSFKDQGVVFFAINAREDVAKIEGFLKSKGLNIPVLLDTEGAVMQAYGVEGIPQSFIIDQKGVIRAAHTGLSGDLKEKLTAELNALVKGEPLPGKPAAQ